MCYLSSRVFFGHVETALKKSFIVLIVSALVLFFNPPHPLMLGFVAGLVLSIVNCFLLALRIDGMARMVLMDPRKAGWFMQFGLGARWAIIIGAFWFAAVSGWFNLFGMAAGFFVPLAFSLGGIMRSWIYQGAKNGVKA